MTSSLALISLTLAALSGRCVASSIMLTYGPSLDLIVPFLDFGEGTITTELDLIRATDASRFANVDLHLSPIISPALASSSNFSYQPIAVASMCLASTNSNTTGLTLKQIAAALSGAPDASTANIQWYVAPLAISPASSKLLQALALASIAPFVSATSWPASVLSNSNVHVLADDQSVSQTLNACRSSTTWCMGPQLGFAPWAAALPCLRIRHTVDLTGDTISYSNRLSLAETAPFTVVDPMNGTAYSQGPVYPFVGALYLTVRRGLSCDKMNAVVQLLTAFFTNSSNGAALASQGLQSVGITAGFTTLNCMLSLSPSDCALDVLTAPIRGDVFLYDAVAALNFDWFIDHSYMGAFNVGTTTDVLVDLYDPATPTHAALTEGLPNATLKATAPSVLAAPIFAHGLSLIYMLDGRDGLVVSFCTLLGIMNGTIRYLDDPALMHDNVGILLPHLKITRVVSYDGSREAAGRGVSYVARRCGRTLSSSYTSYPFTADVTVTGLHNVAFQVQTTEGAFGLAPASSAAAASMQTLSIVFPSGQQLSGSQNDLAAVVGKSTVNATTNAFKFPSRTVDYYPFVAVVYAVFDTDAAGDCEAYTRTLAWLLYVVGSAAVNVLTNSNQAVLTDALRAPVITLISQTKCDGIVLFPVAVQPFLWWPYAVVAACLIVLCAVLALRAGLRYMALRVRPSDSTKAIAVMFVGVKNPAAVLEAGEENAAAVHARVAETVRQMVRKHGCYEARRIDAVTMMIVAKDAARAFACAEDVVLTLSVDVPWLDTVMTQRIDPNNKHLKMGRSARMSLSGTGRAKINGGTPRTDVTSNKEGDHVSSSDEMMNSKRSSARKSSSDSAARRDSELAASRIAPSKTSMGAGTQRSHTTKSGLTLQQCVPEVYAGLHWTHVMMDIQDDAASYHGAGINAAATVADLAVGGQIVVSRPLMDQLNLELGDNASGLNASIIGEGIATDDMVGMSLTTHRFPDWLIARAVLRRKSLEEKDGHEGNLLAAAIASADGSLAKRRVAAVSLLVRDLLSEGADGRASVVGGTLAQLMDIVTSNRGQIHSITDGIVTVTVGAGAPVAMAPVRAAQIAMEASEHCIAIGVNSGNAMVGNAMGGRPATVGRIVAGAALMRLVAARTGVSVCATDIAKADLAANFELATIDLIATPWDNDKFIRCYAVVEERRVAEGDTEWLYDMRDGFSAFEQRFDDQIKKQRGVRPLDASALPFACRHEPTYLALQSFNTTLTPRDEEESSTAPARSAIPASHQPFARLSDILYCALQTATEKHTAQDFYLCRLGDLGHFSLINGARAVVV